MFSSSKDILLITIAVCITAFTFFSCWGLYYLVGMIRNVFKISKDARNILIKVEETIEALKDKIHSSSSYLLLIGEAVKKILEIMGSMKSGEGIGFPFKKKTREEDYDDYGERRRGPRRGKPRNVKVKGK